MHQSKKKIKNRLEMLLTSIILLSVSNFCSFYTSIKSPQMDKVWNSDPPSQLSPRAERRFIQVVTQDPGTTSTTLQVSFFSFKVNIHDSTKGKL